ncbi:type IV toxin-antitoxin system AbiEi family antitoxin domain-containing protein [Smaragdicoccus niigatensis]|uniref:type IV toxin-antitoxin system AbiEi family antitoxin domain-containing protein n=1 Tax=Smaragdicoccus niigatensis TaxID=359359 RepID=UPI0003815AD4|nr:type IV toxin-antitoxin system AbiEi family antitoxin domain-containing protein [Smaragdicoccus niigatensis]
MEEVERLIARYGGVVSTRQLIAGGMPKAEIRKLGWDRPRRGWYASPNANARVLRAVKAGGVVSCVSVLRLHGVWVSDTELHIRYAARALRPTGRNCQPYRRRPREEGSIDTLDVALACAVNCLDPEQVVVALDSALNKRLIQMADATTLIRDSKYAHLRLDEKCERDSESGLETMTRLRLRSRNIAVRIQVVVGDIGRVDLLIGRSLIIECDGEDTHREKFHADRERDRRLKALGFNVIRLTKQDIEDNWKDAEQDILAVIRRGDHLKPAQVVV